MRVICSSCGRPTYRGCGQHVDEVLGDVPESERCSCGSDGAGGNRARRSWFSRRR